MTLNILNTKTFFLRSMSSAPAGCHMHGESSCQSHRFCANVLRSCTHAPTSPAGLPLRDVPSMIPKATVFTSLSSDIQQTWPKKLSFLFIIYYLLYVSTAWSLMHMTSFLQELVDTSVIAILDDSKKNSSRGIMKLNGVGGVDWV